MGSAGGGSRTWDLVALDRGGGRHVLDANDLPPAAEAPLPMAAVSGRGVLWAVAHAGSPAGAAARCELRYASLADFETRVVASEPCDRTEFWYPRSDGRRFVYGTVEYGPDGTGDDRHV
jgi:hypothetical protein